MTTNRLKASLGLPPSMSGDDDKTDGAILRLWLTTLVMFLMHKPTLWMMIVTTGKNNGIEIKQRTKP
jgi:hypothetical protein